MNTNIDEYIKRVKSLISEHGFMIQSVFGSDTSSQFSYSIGFHNFGWPEIIIVGLSRHKSHAIISNIKNEMETNKIILAGSIMKDLANLKTAFISVSEKSKKEYCTQIFNYYKHWNFDVLQLVWPDKNEKFHWEPDFQKDFNRLQTLLNDNHEFINV